MFSFTLQVKSDGYDRTPSTRVFLCASSPDESGRHALDWAIEGLVQDGDELIVFRGIDQDDLGLSIRLVNPLIVRLNYHLQRKIMTSSVMRPEISCIGYKSSASKSIRSERYPLLLPRLWKDRHFYNLPSSQLSIIVEYIAGKVTTTIDRLIALYRPDSVVVGSRGARKMKQAFGAAFGAQSMGGVSKYCLSHSPVPVIVVRPESKVRKTLDKRRADPKRGIHFDEYESLSLDAVTVDPNCRGSRLQSPRSNSGPGLSITSTMSR
jgi:hypothetical protein